MAAWELVPGWAGVDEAGRGPLAGPLVVAAVLLPAGFAVEGLDDSKKLTPAKREAQRERILDSARWCLRVGEPDEVDRLGIFRLTMTLMAECLEALDPEGGLVDGNHRPPTWLPVRCEPKADGRFAAVAAASILAKTHRDARMVEAEHQWPGYGFAEHKGYPTEAHREALQRLGPCPIHRRSFAPVAECLTCSTGG